MCLSADSGIRCVLINYAERPADADIEPSFSSVGDSFENILSVTINCICKAKVIHRRETWRFLEFSEPSGLSRPRTIQTDCAPALILAETCVLSQMR